MKKKTFLKHMQRWAPFSVRKKKRVLRKNAKVRSCKFSLDSRELKTPGDASLATKLGTDTCIKSDV